MMRHFLDLFGICILHFSTLAVHDAFIFLHISAILYTPCKRQVKSCADRPFQCLNSSEAQSCDLRKPAVTYQHNARMLVVSWAKIVSGLSDEY